jgi:oligopeptide/dipeptide ABC transporter ATP-binding protein
MSTPAGAPVLDIDGLSVTIHTEDRSLTVVDDVTISVGANEVVCVVGESGSGKSVTMLSAMRLMDDRIVDYAGSIRFAGEDLLRLDQADMRQVRGSGIAMIFQDPMTALNPVYPVGWQIVEQIRAHREISADAARRQAVDLLRTVGIAEPERRVASFPHELSGGMRQRVMIALALSCQPQLLIADEPTTALDVTIQAQILRLIRDLQEQTGMSVVLVTHDMGVVAETADRVVVMYGGRVVETGPVTQIFDDPRHPYTRGLLGSIPRLGGDRPRRLTSIEGTPATAGQAGGACVFVARCPHRFEPCDAQPALLPVGLDHFSACHLNEVDAGGASGEPIAGAAS